MRKIAVIIGTALAISAAPASAATKADAMHWEMGFQVLSALDAAETIYCLRTSPTCEEANPLMGKHPSTLKIIAGKAIMGGLHFALVDHLADKNPRLALRVAQISVVFQGTVVGLNARIVF